CDSTPSPPVVAPITASAPIAPAARPFADTMHGVVVPDDYRWLEDSTHEDVGRWMAAERAYADTVMRQAVGADSIARGIERLFATIPTLGRVRESDEGLVFERWLGERPSLVSLAAGQSTERMLLPDSALARARGGARLRAFVPSWDGRLIAIGTTLDGDLAPGISVLDATTGRLLPDHIPDLLSTTSGTRYEVTWLRDGSGFIYPREWPGAADGPPAERLARGRQFIHRLGTAQSSDVAIFGFEVSRAVPADPEDLPTRVYTAADSDWLVAAAISRRADRGEIVRLVLGRATPADASWETVVAERAGVITTFALQADALYFAEREGGAVGLHRVRAPDTAPGRLQLPFAGGLDLLRRPTTRAGATFSLSTWSSPPRFYRADPASAAPVPLGIDDGSSTAPSTIVSERIEARSADGTMIPLSVTYDRATLASGRLDGSASLFIEAYGGFGQSTDPEFAPHVQTWLALGGVYTYAHVRGGGELGDAWHRAAMREGKQRTLDDMVAAIETLIARRYTAPGRVVLSGFSFGAHIPGLIVAQRPELLGAIVFGAGTPDEIRGAARDPTAARNLNELGDLSSASGIRLLMAASPYHRVPAQLALPAVVVHSARADYNFGNEMLVAKYVARLRAANTGSRPVLWVRTDGGHTPLVYGEPTLAARTLAFLLWQTGDPRYQPR
ncbi:MAG: prolyl oligopeptidase family serine peptidase, partial [Gemmatimonadaceae bacterium]|nr:prolyl oligopeptidase family serine peptidase [Gemmatimonadaceae bacterium]